MENDDVEEEAEEQQPVAPSAIKHFLLLLALAVLARGEDTSPHSEGSQGESDDQRVLESNCHLFLPQRRL